MNWFPDSLTSPAVFMNWFCHTAVFFKAVYQTFMACRVNIRTMGIKKM